MTVNYIKVLNNLKSIHSIHHFHSNYQTNNNTSSQKGEIHECDRDISVL